MRSTKPPTEHVVELWPLERLQPYERNPRLCPQRAIEKVAAWIAEFGFRSADPGRRQGVIIAGHTRWPPPAARPCPGAVDRSCELWPRAGTSLRLADNRTAQETSWNDELLGPEIADLAAGHYDLDLLGFDCPELSALLNRRRPDDPDAVPEPP